MSKAIKEIMIRVIKNRISSGETIEEIFESYPRLSNDEKQELKSELNITD